MLLYFQNNSTLARGARHLNAEIGFYKRRFLVRALIRTRGGVRGGGEKLEF